MKLIKNIAIVLLVLAGFHSFAETYRIRTQTEFDQVQKQTVFGDSIVWGRGSYSNVNLSLEADGVFFVAETSGAVIFTGRSDLAVSGNGNTLIGFQFVKGKIKVDVVDISGNNNTIQQVNIEAYDSHYYLRIRTNCQYNSILYCNFEAKPETQESSVNPVSIDPGNTESWQSNYIQNGNTLNSGKVKVAGYRFVQNTTGLYEIEVAKEAFADFVSSELFIFEIQELDDDSGVGFDMMKQVRDNNSNDLPGCYLPSEKSGLKFYATADDTGPEYLQ